MQQYERFIFSSYDFHPEEGKIELHYSLDEDVHFTETILIPMDAWPCEELDERKLEPLLFLLHLIGGISYFKTCLPKTIEVRSGSLTKKQATFWNTVYENGLGEFFFQNKIDFRGKINFPAGSDQPLAVSDDARSQPLTANRSAPGFATQGLRGRRVLVPFGGGKDSIVTMEMLKNAGCNVTLMRCGHHPVITALAHQARLPLLNIERHLDAQLFKLNADGALNGHVPITAYLSILSVLAAQMLGFEATVWSNERSASEGNAKLLDLEVNHQWSKGIAFERALREQIAPITGVEYFSLLRPFSELSIVERFCATPQYLRLFTSCNTNWKIKKDKKTDAVTQQPLWCGTCPKCAFAYASLAAFLPEAQLQTIFGKDLFSEQALLPIYRQLLGLEGFKPFECVGTTEETQAAFLLAHKRGDLNDTPVMKLFVAKSLPTITDTDALLKKVRTVSEDHCIPEDYASLIIE